MRTLPRSLSLLLVLTTPLPVRAAVFLPFTVKTERQGSLEVSALLQGETVILRLRDPVGGNSARVRVQRAAEQLNALAWQGFAPEDVKVDDSRDKGARGPIAKLMVRQKPILTVDTQDAAAAQSTPRSLAEQWAARIRKAVTEPYLMLKTDRLEIPVGESRPLEYGGRPDTSCEPVSTNPEVAQATINRVERVVVLRGVGAGTTLGGVRAGKAEALATVVVRKWAASVAEPVVVRVSGSPQANHWLRRAAYAAALQRVQVEPGARATIQAVSLSGPRSTVTVAASGPDYFGFERAYPLIFSPVDVPGEEPVRAILSNDPERVYQAQCLALTEIRLGEPIHYLWHHIAGGPQRLQVVVRVHNTGSRPASVHVIGADAGPSEDEVFVGHAVMQRFMAALIGGSGIVFEVPPGLTCELSRLPMPVGHVVSGLARIVLIAGEGVYIETAALPEDDIALPVYTAPASLSIRRRPPILELPGYKQVELRHEVGKAWGFLRIGRTPEDAQLHPRLRGEYGVVHDIRVVFENPGRQDARLELAIRSGGGPARGVILVNDELLQTGLLGQGQEEILWKRVNGTAPRQSVRVRLIPQSGSNYPMNLIARSFSR